MTYIINENLLEEIALHVGPKKFTFGKVYNAIKTWTESRFAHISRLEWFNFLIEEPRTFIIPFNEIKFRYDSETKTFINPNKEEGEVN